MFTRYIFLKGSSYLTLPATFASMLKNRQMKDVRFSLILHCHATVIWRFISNMCVLCKFKPTSSFDDFFAMLANNMKQYQNSSKLSLWEKWSPATVNLTRIKLPHTALHCTPQLSHNLETNNYLTNTIWVLVFEPK